MGYFVIVRCANLPHWIRNGEGVGGGRVVGWIPIVSIFGHYLESSISNLIYQVAEEPQHKRKTSFVNFKRVIWHKSFLIFLATIAPYAKTGFWHRFESSILRCLFPLVYILSSDYEEQYVKEFFILLNAD